VRSLKIDVLAGLRKTSARTYGFGLPHKVSDSFRTGLRRNAGVRVLASKSEQPSSTVTDPVEIDLLKEWR